MEKLRRRERVLKNHKHEENDDSHIDVKIYSMKNQFRFEAFFFLYVFCPRDLCFKLKILHWKLVIPLSLLSLRVHGNRSLNCPKTVQFC